MLIFLKHCLQPHNKYHPKSLKIKDNDTQFAGSTAVKKSKSMKSTVTSAVKEIHYGGVIK